MPATKAAVPSPSCRSLHFDFDGMSFAVAVEQPMAQLVRRSGDKPVTAETWLGACMSEEVDIDAIKAG